MLPHGLIGRRRITLRELTSIIPVSSSLTYQISTLVQTLAFTMAALLPREVWILIVQFVATPVDSDSSTKGRHHRAFPRLSDVGTSAQAIQSDLCRLCLTSHQLRSLATPFLYKAPVTRKTSIFVRTLLDNPELARHVRSLTHRLWNAWSRGGKPTLDPRFIRLAREQEARQRQKKYNRSWREIVEVAAKEGPDDEGENVVAEVEIEWARKDQSLFGAAAMSLLPNLTDVWLYNKDVTLFPGIPANSFPRLVAAKIELHGEGRLPARGMVLERLTLVAPNLRSLTLFVFDPLSSRIPPHGFWGDGPEEGMPSPAPLFPRVTQLCIRRCLLPDRALPTMLVAFPALQDLHIGIEPMPGVVASTAGLEAALLEHAPGLRRLRVEALSFHATGPHDDVSRMTWTPALAGLTELRVLESGQKLFRSDDHGYPLTDSRLTGEDGLVSILPPGLEVLVLSDGHGGSHRVAPALKGLAEAVRSGRFPAPKRFMYPKGGSEEPSMLGALEMLEEQGIEVVGEDRHVACSELGDNFSCMRYYD